MINTSIGILSDTHGFIHPNIIKLMNQCDIIIHAGDIIDEKTLQTLKPKQKLIAIQGNNDTHITHLNLIEKLSFSSGNIIIEHGHKHGHHQPSHNSLRSAYPNSKIIIYGHTHKQVIDKIKTPWIINPGAAGKTRNHGGSKCFILKINHFQKWQIIPYIFN
ncbi:MAG: metallophosphoesterase family protein [Candidatus Vesicomyosocius endoextente]|uniref:Phosphoesterase n=1 Tax=Candidatus Vesicomyosocius endoextente TaxID=2738853 RepID=A0A853G2L6_9GAMM|nr:metallophosphoesterase family protein [Candidatus Vesicomyosocius endoextente]